MYDELFQRLAKSDFRSKFKLKPKDREYLEKKGLEVIESHARDFIAKRIAPANIPNDGKQTPTKGHPVFTAQHATATCCSCMLCSKYRVSFGRCLFPVVRNICRCNSLGYKISSM